MQVNLLQGARALVTSRRSDKTNPLAQKTSTKSSKNWSSKMACPGSSGKKHGPKPAVCTSDRSFHFEPHPIKSPEIAAEPLMAGGAICSGLTTSWIFSTCSSLINLFGFPVSRQIAAPCGYETKNMFSVCFQLPTNWWLGAGSVVWWLGKGSHLPPTNTEVQIQIQTNWG